MRSLRSGLALFILSVLSLQSGAVVGAMSWEFAGWSAGGAFPMIHPDPNVNGKVFLTSDVVGLFGSDDRGTAWQFKTKGLKCIYVSSVAVSNSDPNVVYVGTQNCMQKSTDGGATWVDLTSTRNFITFSRPENYRSIAVDRLDPNKVYAGDKLGRVHYSADGGATWSYLGGVQQPFGTQTQISALYVSRDGRYVFAGAVPGLRRYDRTRNVWDTIDTAGNAVRDIVGHRFQETIYITYGKKIAYTEDFGTTWRYTNDVTTAAGYNYRISVSSDAQGNIRMLTGWRDGWNGSAYVSVNGGTTWTNIERNLTHDVTADPTRVWATGFGWPLSVAIDPFQPDTLYFTDFWGVWRSDNNGLSWNEIIRDLPNTIGSDVVVSPNGSILVGVMDNGLLQSTDGGRTYRALSPKVSTDETAKGHVWRVLALGTTGNRIVATNSPWNYSYNQMLISEDGGLSFTKSRTGLPASYPTYDTVWDKGYPRAIAADPNDPLKIYLGIDGNQGGGFFVSSDGGYTWTKPASQPASLRIYNGLAVDPTSPNRLYWATTGSGGGVYRSENYGQSWTKVMNLSYYVFDLAVARDGTVYAGADTGGAVLYRSSDRGATWSQVKKFSNTGTCEGIAIDPSNPNRIAVSAMMWGNAAPSKIYLSEDRGATWSDITGDLPDGAGAAAMAFTPDGSTLYMSRFAGSVYKLVFGAPTGDTIAPSAPASLAGTVSTGRADLTWQASTDNVGVAGYRVYRDGTQIGSPAATSYADTAATPGATHAYTVKAFDAAGNLSAASAAVSLTIPAAPAQDNEPPSVPTGLAYTSTATSVTLSWTASTDDVGVSLYRVFRNGVELMTTATTGATDSAVAAGLSYTYAVRAEDAAGHVSANSAPLTVTVTDPNDDSIAPSAPSGLTATLSGTTASLGWTAATDNVAVTGYRVYSGSTQIGDVASTSFSHSGLAAGVTYVYTVKAYDAAANLSSASGMASVTVPTSDGAPTAPPNLTGSWNGSGVYLSWGASTDDVAVSGYNVYRDGVYQATRGALTRYYTDTAVTAGATYVYTVKAYDAQNNRSEASNAVSMTIPGGSGGPAAPTGLGATFAGTTVTLTWTPSVGTVNGYRVYRNGAQIAQTSTASHVDTTGTAGSSYAYTVKAYDGSGESAASNTATVTLTTADVTPPSAPSALTGSYANGAVTLSWTASTDDVGVVGYNVYRDGQYLASRTGTSHTDTGVAEGSTYVYTVKAYDLPSNLSAASNAATVLCQTAASQTPTTPTGVMASVTGGSVFVSWNASTDDVAVQGYNVYRNGAYLATVGTLNYTDAAVSAGSTYSYTVKAYDAQNNQSPASAAATVTLSSGAPVVNTYWISSLTKNSAKISWKTNVSATGNVRYGTSTALGSFSYDVTGADCSVTLTGLKPGTTYYYQISVSNDAGSKTTTMQSFKTVGNK